MNWIISTTTAWNPGDDWIRMGCLYLLQEAGIEMRSQFYFDRNPALNRIRSTSGNAESNRWKQGHATPLNEQTAVLIAGSPDWGKSNTVLYEEANKHGWPVFFMGLGAENKQHAAAMIDAATATALRRAAAITVRDSVAQEVVAEVVGFVPDLLPCPAYFAPEYVGIESFGFGGAVICSDIKAVMLEAIHHALTWNKPLICHTAFEVNAVVKTCVQLSKDCPRIIYHSDPEETLMAISKFSGVHSGRLHGAIVAAGMGLTVSLLPSVPSRIKAGWKPFKEKSLDDGNIGYGYPYGSYMEILKKA